MSSRFSDKIYSKYFVFIDLINILENSFIIIKMILYYRQRCDDSSVDLKTKIQQYENFRQDFRHPITSGFVYGFDPAFRLAELAKYSLCSPWFALFNFRKIQRGNYTLHRGCFSWDAPTDPWWGII